MVAYSSCIIFKIKMLIFNNLRLQTKRFMEINLNKTLHQRSSMAEPLFIT